MKLTALKSRSPHGERGLKAESCCSAFFSGLPKSEMDLEAFVWSFKSAPARFFGRTGLRMTGGMLRMTRGGNDKNYHNKALFAIIQKRTSLDFETPSLGAIASILKESRTRFFILPGIDSIGIPR